MKLTIKQIANKHPSLILQNEGYEYINKSKLSAEDLEAIDYISNEIKSVFPDFVEFFNFIYDRKGNLGARFDYHWDERFVGVGYFPVEEIDEEIKAIASA